MVTGSTCNSAVGLGQLKQQQAHFDKVILGKDTSHFTKAQHSNMKYGSEHDIYGTTTTVVARVIPVMHPSVEYCEEGCIRVPTNDKTSFLVVSPDGICRTSSSSEPVFIYENKCKFQANLQHRAIMEFPSTISHNCYVKCTRIHVISCYLAVGLKNQLQYSEWNLTQSYGMLFGLI